MVRAISDNSDSRSEQRPFTPGMANKMLPLIRRIAADMIQLDESISAQREQLRGIDALPETIQHDDYQEELRDIRASLEVDERRLESCREELAALGVVAHEPINGAIDFPAVIDRRQVRLCWHPDDERVEYWHEIGQPASKRIKIGSQTFQPKPRG